MSNIPKTYNATPGGLPSIGFDCGDAYETWWAMLQPGIDGEWLFRISRHGGSDQFDVRVTGTSSRASDGIVGLLIRRTNEVGDAIRPDLPPEFIACDEFDTITVY